MSRAVAALFLAILSVDAALAAPPSPPRPIAVLLDDASPATRARALAGIGALGGRVLHDFAEVLVVQLPKGSGLAAYRLAGVREVALNSVTVSPRRARPGPSYGVAAWNAIATGSSPSGRDGLDPGPLEDDALTPPAVTLEAVRAASRGGGATPARAKSATRQGAVPPS